MAAVVAGVGVAIIVVIVVGVGATGDEVQATRVSTAVPMNRSLPIVPSAAA